MQFASIITFLGALLLTISSVSAARDLATAMKMIVEQARALTPAQLPPLIVGQMTPPEYLLRAGYAADFFHAKSIEARGRSTQSVCETSLASPTHQDAWLAAFALTHAGGRSKQYHSDGTQCTNLYVFQSASIAWCGAVNLILPNLNLGTYAMGIANTYERQALQDRTGGHQVLNENSSGHVVLFHS